MLLELKNKFNNLKESVNKTLKSSVSQTEDAVKKAIFGILVIS